MSLSKQTFQRSITILDATDGKFVEVLWIEQVVENDVMLAETNRRCAYSVDDKERFLAEVERAEDYLMVLGW